MVGPQSLRGRRGWELVWVCGGGFPMIRQCFNADNDVQLGVAGDHRKVLEGKGEYRESVGDTVGGSKGRLGKV